MNQKTFLIYKKTRNITLHDEKFIWENIQQFHQRWFLRDNGHTNNKLVPAILADVHSKPYQSLNQLFHLCNKSPIIIDWIKKVNHIELTHLMGIYQNPRQQALLLNQYLHLGYGMYCQRGHSCWVRFQLQIPLTMIQKDNTDFIKTIQNKQRFLSLGSCGSIESYFELGKLFANHVDILATAGIGKTTMNNMYNRKLFEVAANHSHLTHWKEVAQLTQTIFPENDQRDYLQPGSLTSLFF